ncbi:hypothetical protein JCM10207_003081 [Rhodosporidiobolus poonsookiae]
MNYDGGPPRRDMGPAAALFAGVHQDPVAYRQHYAHLNAHMNSTTYGDQQAFQNSGQSRITHVVSQLKASVKKRLKPQPHDPNNPHKPGARGRSSFINPFKRRSPQPSEPRFYPGER